MNFFFLSAGLIALFSSAGHAAYGQKHIMSDVETTEMRKFTKGAVFVSWHQTTSFMFLSAIALIMASSFSEPSAANPLAWLIAAINVGNLFVFIGASLVRNREALGQAIPQIIFMILYVGVIVAGINA